ncbi:peptidylprolyl isomerase [Candidatus Pelagibacter sp.]|uniref:peptidylprolyl isomerase n=1 Tax=Candidatus Pelagibacter sp. TaxID=2024849 RepID=UPI003F879752
MKIDNEIITTHDIEQEINYLKALNPKLDQIDRNKLLMIAKNSIIKEFIKKKEIQKYKKLDLQNSQIDNVLNNLIQNLNLQNENQLISYLDNYDFSIEKLKKKIEIENEWKNLIYSKYIKTVKIDKEELIKKIEKSSGDKSSLEYNLSEIVFTKKKDSTLDELFSDIEESIEKNGFENTANLYSISGSAKVGGKIGWVKKNSLSNIIIDKLDSLEKGQYSSPLRIDNNFLIFKINEIREIQIEINKEKELDKMIFIETTKQLDKFSNIFYNKIKLNSEISEF